MLDSTKESPLYVQLGKILRDEIESDKFKKGEKIPTEAELSKMYNVSRITVRNALDELSKENILIRRRGKGTFVNNNKFVRGVSGSQSFTQMCNSSGIKPGAKVIKCLLENATSADMTDLELLGGNKVMAIERIRSSNGTPVCFEVSRFPESFSFLIHEDLNDCSMFEILEKKHNKKIICTNKYLELIYATYEMTLYLNLPKKHPLLLISALSCDETGKPVHRSKQYVVGDKFKFMI